MKLKQFITNNIIAKHFDLNKRKCFKILDKYIGNMFPGPEEVSQILKKIMESIENKKGHQLDNMPMASLVLLHTRDEDWLAKYIRIYASYYQCESILTNQEGKITNIEIPFEVAKKYVKVSPKFNQYRQKLERDLVKSCIEYGEIDMEKQGLQNSVVYDELLRSRVVMNALKMGIGRDTIETGLERNASVWRKPAMYRTFINQAKSKKPNYLTDSQRDILYKYDENEWEHFIINELQYMHYWVCNRENEYYQKYKKVIDQVGTATPSMKLSKFQLGMVKVNMESAKNKYNNALELSNEYIRDIETYALKR